MNNQCFELTPLSRWYGQRHIVSVSRWNTYAPLMAKVQSHLPGLTPPRDQNHEKAHQKLVVRTTRKTTRQSLSWSKPRERRSQAIRRARPGAQRRRLTSSEEILRRQALLILSVLPTSEREHRAGKRHHRERDHRIGERDHGAQEGVREARSPSCTASSSPSMRWV